MDGHVDWLSWTETPVREPQNIQDTYHIARRTLERISNEHLYWIFDGQGFDRSARLYNFDLCLSRSDHGVRIGGIGPKGYMLFEATGRACDRIREPELSRRIVSGIVDNLSRFDYAVDIHTEVSPSQFVNARKHKAFRSISLVRSDTGETCYIGSRKSDRYCRVYRYAEPHPRAHLLRVEYVFRRAMARATAAQYIQTANQEDFHKQLGNTYGWGHKSYNPSSSTDLRVETPTIDRHSEDTIAWLYKQVLPAMRRLIDNGTLDMTDFLERVYNQQ